MPKPTVQPLVADVMVARLARWLRMLGVSVAGPLEQDDDRIIRQCVAGGATLITRDEALARKAASYCPSILLRASDLDGQVAEFCLATGFPLLSVKASSVPGSRFCPGCNGRLKRISRKAARPLVPTKSFARAGRFVRCASCGKVYWPGSHDSKIRAGLARMKKRLRATAFKTARA